MVANYMRDTTKHPTAFQEADLFPHLPRLPVSEVEESDDGGLVAYLEARAAPKPKE